MDFKIVEDIKDGVFYSTDCAIHTKDSNLLVIGKDYNRDSTLEDVINIVATLNRFDTKETIVYSYIIKSNVDDLNGNKIVSLGRGVVSNIAKLNKISVSSIDKAINSLNSKGVITRIPNYLATYKIPKGYRLNKTFNKNEDNAIVIIL